MSVEDIFKPDFDPPEGFESDDYSCFFTDPDYYLSDYEAVVASRPLLKIWSDSDWPEDDFTPEVNREELGWHVEDNQRHEAYGYMLYDRNRRHCHGSIYVNPITRMTRDYQLLEGDASVLSEFQARVDYWIRSGDDAAQLGEVLYRWLQQQWRINAAFTARGGDPARAGLYRQIGMTHTHTLQSLQTGNTLSLYR